MKTEEFIRILQKYENGTASFREKQLVESYFDKKTSQNSKVIPFDSVKAKKDTFAQIEANLAKEKETKFSRYWGIAIAASIILCLGLFFGLSATPNVELQTVATAYGQKKQILLPDGTSVYLNSGSSLQYPKNFTGDTREVSLTGEAFFEVHRDEAHPFIITTSELRTQVLGTSFNINAFAENDSISVSVATGKVMVFDNSQMKELLIPGQKVQYNKSSKTYVRGQVQVDRFTDWTRNIIRFDDSNLLEAIPILERWFNISIELKDSSWGEKRITGTYKNPNLSETLESLSFLLDLKFVQKSPTSYIVTNSNKSPM